MSSTYHPYPLCSYVQALVTTLEEPVRRRYPPPPKSQYRMDD